MGTVRIISSGSHNKTVNSKRVYDQNYNVAINPNGKSNVYASVKKDGKQYNYVGNVKQFMNNLSKNDNSIFDTVAKNGNIIYKKKTKKHKNKGDNIRYRYTDKDKKTIKSRRSKRRNRAKKYINKGNKTTKAKSINKSINTKLLS